MAKLTIADDVYFLYLFCVLQKKANGIRMIIAFKQLSYPYFSFISASR